MDTPMQSKIVRRVFLWFWKFMEIFTGILFTISFIILMMFHWFCFSLQQIYNKTVLKRYQVEHQYEVGLLDPPELVNFIDLQPVLHFQQFIPINMNADAA